MVTYSPSELLAVVAELRAEAQERGITLSLEDAISIARGLLPTLEWYAERYDTWAAAEAARVEGLSDAQHLAYEAEVARPGAVGLIAPDRARTNP